MPELSIIKMYLALLGIFLIFLQYVGSYVINWSFMFRWSTGYVCNSSYHHHPIGCINLFWHNFHGCVPQVVVPSYAVGFMHIPGSWVIFLTVQSFRVHYGPMVVFVSLHITLPHFHHYADISERIELVNDWAHSPSYLVCDTCENACTLSIVIIKAE